MSEILENATEPPYEKYYAPVPAQKVINVRVQATKLGQTLIVHGPRGVGKMTVVQNALVGVKSVIHIEPSPLTVEISIGPFRQI